MVAAGDEVNASDVSTIEDYTIRKPICRIIQQSGGTQSLADNTLTAIAFAGSSEDIDTNDFHNSALNDSRITPTIAGYYRVTATLWIACATTTANIYAAVAKNGSNVLINRAKPDVANVIASSVQVTATVSCNGTTDYIEMNGLQDDTGGTARSTVTGAATSCTLEVVFERPI